MSRVTQAQELLGRQYGVITAAQALSCGVTRHGLRVLVDTGAWVRLGAGLFVLSGSPASFEQKVMAACLAAGPGAVASHRTAARLLDVGPRRTSRIEITNGTGNSTAGAHRLGAKVYRTRHLDRQDRVVVARLPVTHPARLLMDLAGQLSTGALERLVDDVLYRYPVVNPQAILDRLGNQAGGPALRQALGPWLTGPRPGSPPEMQLFRRLSELSGDAERGQPERQHPVTDPQTGRLLGRVDLAYPERKIAIEYNGRRYHDARAATRDEERRQGIVDVGWTVEETGLMS